MTTIKPTVVSLFSGAGGFDWGFHRAGFETLLAVELEISPAETLAHNLKLKTLNIPTPPTPITPTMDDLPAVIQGDVHLVDFSDLTSMQPDVLIGGPPCQDFSVTKGSEREGLDGGRGKLYLEFLRGLMFLQPKMFVFENVPGFISANDGLAYETVLDDLQNLENHRCHASEDRQSVKVPQQSVLGYDILFSDIVEAPNLGIAQTRRRLIIVGIRTDLISTYAGLTGSLSNEVKTVLNGSRWKFSRFPMTTLEIFEGQPLRNLRDRYKEIMGAFSTLGVDIPFAQATQWRENAWARLSSDSNIVRDYYAACGLDYERNYNAEEFDSAMNEHEQLLRQLNWLGKPVHKLIDPHNTLPKQSKNVRNRMYQIPPGGNAKFVDGTGWAVRHQEISFIYRRALLLRPAWTVMAYGGGGTYGYHYERDRQMLTLRERARIQTFSDDFEFKESGVRAQIGEAVPPLMGERIAYSIREVLDCVDRHTRHTIAISVDCDGSD